MQIKYKGKIVGGLGYYGTSYFFIVKTKKTHKVFEFTAKNLGDAVKKCEKICDELAKIKK